MGYLKIWSQTAKVDFWVYSTYFSGNFSTFCCINLKQEVEKTQKSAEAGCLKILSLPNFFFLQCMLYQLSEDFKRFKTERVLAYMDLHTMFSFGQARKLLSNKICRILTSDMEKNILFHWSPSMDDLTNIEALLWLWRLWESKTHFHCVDLPMRDSLDPQSLCSLSPVQLPSSRFPVFWHTLLKWLPFLWFTSANVLWCFTAVKSPSFIVILLSYLYVRCLDWFSTFSIYKKMYKMIQFLTTCIYMN